MTKEHKTTWQLMKETGTPEEKREYDLMELEHLKSQQRYFKNTPPEQRKEMVKNNLEVRKAAQKILKTYEATNDFMYAKDFNHYLKKVNPKHFEKIADNLKNRIPESAKENVEQFKNKISEAREKGQLAEVNKDRKGLNTIVYYNAEDAAKPRPPKTIKPTEDFRPDEDSSKGLAHVLGVDDNDFKTPESEFMRVPEFLEKHYKPEPDPDLKKGLGTLKQMELPFDDK
ncbi:MAG: hypothetical protein MRY23_06590 [Pelagibacteraceae bacterium]|jgi:hypothetical protein|nr:hypothetical protein [Pelagibacteraceae bacterium]MCI5078803.1 hypothetical protein [Pelagibacteraceae bacterium]